MVLVAPSFFNVYQVRYSPPLELLTSTLTKNQLKLLFKKKVSSYWSSYYCSLCPSYSSLQYFDTTKLLPNKPHPYIVHSGTSEFVNRKTSIILKLLCGRYRLNSLRHKFSNTYSPIISLLFVPTLMVLDNMHCYYGNINCQILFTICSTL